MSQFKRALSTTAPKVVRSTAASGSTITGSSVYENSRAVAEYLLFHYGKPEELFPHSLKYAPVHALNFPARVAHICGSLLPSVPIHEKYESMQDLESFSQEQDSVDSQPTRILDIGCAVGGSSFELSKYFNEVVGIDFSHKFIEAANEMKTKHSMVYDVYTEASNMVLLKAELPSFVKEAPEKFIKSVSFQQGDACDLPPISEIGQFDVVLGSNLLCRLPSPRKFLTSLLKGNNKGVNIDGYQGYIKPNGYLVLVSPYSWLEEYTPVNEWLFKPVDRVESNTTYSCNSFEQLSEYVKNECHTTTTTILPDNTKVITKYQLQLHHRDEHGVPFLIREHARKYQYGLSDCTIFRNVPIQVEIIPPV